MKMLRKAFTLFFVVIVLLNLSYAAFASTYDLEVIENKESENTVSTCASFEPCCYGATNWSSLSAAMNYYGVDYKYVYCGGTPYNYYYTFADGSKMFFGVIMS